MPRSKKTTRTPRATRSVERTSDVEREEVKSSSFFSNINSKQILVALLVVMALAAGYLFSRVQYLESSNKQAVMNNPNAPQPSTAPIVADVDKGNYPALGDDKAKVTIVEFEDFRCPFCKQSELNVMSQIKKEYVDTGKVKIYFRNWAFLGPASTLAANAAECANEQNKFWDMHNYLYQNQPDETDTSMYTVENLTSVAGQLGMDTSSFQNCLSTNKYNDNVTKDYNDGQKAGVSATPTYYINGVQLVGAQPYTAFKQAIDAALSK